MDPGVSFPRNKRDIVKKLKAFPKASGEEWKEADISWSTIGGSRFLHPDLCGCIQQAYSDPHVALLSEAQPSADILASILEELSHLKVSVDRLGVGAPPAHASPTSPPSSDGEEGPPLEPAPVAAPTVATSTSGRRNKGRRIPFSRASAPAPGPAS